MPTYAYACRDCDHRFEAVQSFSDDSLSICPACDGSLRKVFNSVGVVFKGGGFYRTDSRAASSSSTPASTSTESGSDSKGSDSKGSDSKGSSSAGSSSTGSSSSNASSNAAPTAASA